MHIRWFGQSFFEVTTDTELTKGVKIYFDPYGDVVGLRPPENLEADIVLVSHQHPDHNNTGLFKNIGFTVNTSGEYSVKGVDIRGIQAYHDNNQGKDRGSNIIFSLESEGINIVHLGDLGHILSEKNVQEIGSPEILMVPIGGNHSLNGNEATKVIKQLEPKIVIPMHYKIPNLTAELDGIDKFCKEMGICVSESLKALSVRASDLSGKEMEVVELEPNKN